MVSLPTVDRRCLPLSHVCGGYRNYVMMTFGSSIICWVASALNHSSWGAFVARTNMKSACRKVELCPPLFLLRSHWFSTMGFVIRTPRATSHWTGPTCPSQPQALLMTWRSFQVTGQVTLVSGATCLGCCFGLGTPYSNAVQPWSRQVNGAGLPKFNLGSQNHRELYLYGKTLPLTSSYRYVGALLSATATLKRSMMRSMCFNWQHRQEWLRDMTPPKPKQVESFLMRLGMQGP